MKKFENPAIEIEKLEMCDVIATSTGCEAVCSTETDLTSL